MARIAELSMMKAQLLDSERERTKLQEELEDAYHRLEKGTFELLKGYYAHDCGVNNKFRSCTHA